MNGWLAKGDIIVERCIMESSDHSDYSSERITHEIKKTKDNTGWSGRVRL